MINQINQDIFEAVITEAKIAIQKQGEMEQRWIKAIEKAVIEIENNPFMHFDSEHQQLVLWSQSSYKTYEANGKCQCKAYYVRNPCYHRAAARLLQRYYEKLECSR
jgi:hypothetical protein